VNAILDRREHRDDAAPIVRNAPKIMYPPIWFASAHTTSRVESGRNRPFSSSASDSQATPSSSSASSSRNT
jgi:hypothetical protein